MASSSSSANHETRRLTPRGNYCADSQYPPWPNGLYRRQGLKTNRGEVIVIDGICSIIVGFDGRHQAYLCWAWPPGTNAFDTSKTIQIPMDKAHAASRANRQKLPLLPTLPEIDHMGKFDNNKARKGYSSHRSGSGESQTADVPAEPVVVKTSKKAQHSARSSQSEALHGGEGAAGSNESFGLSNQGNQYASEPSIDNERVAKKCSWCAVIEAINVPISFIRSWLRGSYHAVCGTAAEPLTSNPSSAALQSLPSVDNISSSSIDKTLVTTLATKGPAVPFQIAPPSFQVVPDGRRLDKFDDMRITIPIVIPPSWNALQHLVRRMPVTFDERGAKETMTVKLNRWDAFVDRQKQTLQNELQKAQEGNSTIMGASVCKEQRASQHQLEQVPSNDDISELQRMVERMDDWKDLTRYSGKSVSMASTTRGNEMKIHVMAFAENSSKSGIDFMRVSYKKSVEVRDLNSQLGGCAGIGGTLRSILPFMALSPEETAEEDWIQLLQQPDLAKFTIALAFRGALENDGLHLEFCESNLDDPTCARV